VTKLKLSLTLP